jgi:imidazolonepropionase-like amidohydrolase
MAQVVPVGGTISGTTSVMELDGWNWEDAAYKSEEGVYMNWPFAAPPARRRPDPGTETPQVDEFDRQVNEIKGFFDQARAYSLKQKPEEINLKFEAMKPVFKGLRKLYIRANTAREMQSAVIAMKEYGITPIIAGGLEAWRIVKFLKDNNVSIVYAETQRLPQYEDDDVAQAYQVPAQLAAAGVSFSLSVDGSWQVRNLPFQVGQAIPYGLDKETALNCITIVPAKMMGIDKTTGSLELGKDATLFISDGDMFDMRTNNITRAFIRGKDIDLDNKQKQLYRKYKHKYGL